MLSNRATRSRFGFSALVFALLSFLISFATPTPVAAANCTYTYGFKTLYNLIPSAVGNCVTDESYAPNGDGLQQTTNGLLVWRKADNHTAFTNGYNTWVLGPNGLQERLNNARFAWEPDVAPALIDPRLSASYQLAAHSKFSGLIAALVSGGVPVSVSNVSSAWGAFGFNGGHPVIVISPTLLTGDPNDAAAVLVHEATHFQQYRQQPDFTHSTSAECLNDEIQASANDLAYWQGQFGARGKQPPTNTFEQQINYQLGLAETDPQSFSLQTAIDYQQECG